MSVAERHFSCKNTCSNVQPVPGIGAGKNAPQPTRRSVSLIVEDGMDGSGFAGGASLDVVGEPGRERQAGRWRAQRNRLGLLKGERTLESAGDPHAGPFLPPTG